MRVVSLNVNGIRSAAKKGVFQWLKKTRSDVICVQELKAQESDLSSEIKEFHRYEGYFHCAVKKGYSGVAVYSAPKPVAVQHGLGDKAIDTEGRYLQVDYPNLSVVSVYLPSGSSGPERQASKFRFMKKFLPHLKKLRAMGREFILCGDWNIAHKEVDLKNWRSNQKNSGFLPEEREWLTQVFDTVGFVDVFRQVNTQAEQYTWWSNRGQAWAKNVGWRIDYHIATPKVAKTAHKVHIYKDERFSDHAPLVIDYQWDVTKN